MHVITWEFTVRAGCEADFERVYGPRGAWAELFASSSDYVGTELWRDHAQPGRYVSVDRWKTADAFAQWKAQHAEAYLRLDAQCEAWTETETKLGEWLAL
jgi:heme-degrading monooxygenase HmoA